MNPETIENALIQACKTAASGAGLAPALPNVNVDPGVLPRVEFQRESVGRVGGTLKGNEIITERGYFYAVICTEKGRATATANDLARTVAAVYPEGQRITSAGITITILEPPLIRPGFPDASCWRVPVVVRYRADVAV